MKLEVVSPIFSTAFFYPQISCKEQKYPRGKWEGGSLAQEPENAKGYSQQCKLEHLVHEFHSI